MVRSGVVWVLWVGPTGGRTCARVGLASKWKTVPADACLQVPQFHGVLLHFFIVHRDHILSLSNRVHYLLSWKRSNRTAPRMTAVRRPNA